MNNKSSSSQSYNNYINGSKFRFLPIEELKKKHFIVTDIDNDEDFQTLQRFMKKPIKNTIQGRKERLFYRRYRPIKRNSHTYAKQTIIKEMCQPNEYGIPDMLFKYDEFYTHYIRPTENQ